MIQKYDMTQYCNLSQYKKKRLIYKSKELIVEKIKKETKNNYASGTEFEVWIKYMNYKLFLEHAHSKEYYIQKKYFLNYENGEKSNPEK